MKRSIGIETPLYPAPALVVSTYDSDDNPNAMVAAWGGICCSTPPCIAISLRRERHTYQAILDREAFTVNIPQESLVKEADLFGIISGSEEDKFAISGLTPVRGELVDAPSIEEFPISIECKLVKTVELGSHTQFIGEVVNCTADESCLDKKGQPDPQKVKPIVFMPKYGRYYGLGEIIGRAFSSGKELLEKRTK